MKILFIEVQLGTISWGVNYNPGVASIASVLNQNNYEVDIFPVNKKEDIKKLISYLNVNDIQVIGFTVTEPTLLSIAQLSQMIKKRYPKIYIVCGGLYSILDPLGVINTVNCDSVCIGEGEYSMLEIVKRLDTGAKEILDIKNCWFRKGKKIIKNSLDFPIDINKLPSPNREIFFQKKLDEYVGNIYLKDKQRGGITIVSRGCYFNCSFCGNWILNEHYKGKYRRVMDPKLAVDRLKEIVKKYKYDYLIFIDAQFPTHSEWLDKFASLYQKKVKIPFTVQLRFGSFDEQTVVALKKAGCYSVQIGLESGDREIRYNVLNKKIGFDLISQGTQLFKKHGIKVCLNNMIGLPMETAQKFRKTIETNAMFDLDCSHLFIYYPYRGTELYKYCLKHNLLRKNINNLKIDGAVLKLRNFKKTDILYFYKYFHKLVSVYRKSLEPTVVRAYLWKKLYSYYSLSPSERKKIWSKNCLLN
ncbi:MAG: radical SAM protein [Patescibacteria group bacterium]